MATKEKRRIAITGIGMVTPLGNTAPDTWAALLAGKSGAAPTQSFDASGFSTTFSAEVKDFDAEAIIPNRKLLKYASKSHAFALAAAQEALTDAGIAPTAADSHRWGLSVGAGMLSVGYDDLKTVCDFAAPDGEFHADGLLDPDFPGNPVNFCRWQSNAGLGLLTKQFGIRGYATSVHTACASGGQAIGTALKVMRRGQCDFMLAGGFDSMINPIGISGFCLLGALSTDNDNPTGASRPFDANRNGFVLGEGAGFLVLEDWERARSRGAKIYAELAGDGNSLSSYRITDSPPDGNGPIQAIQQALADAGITADGIDYVNAHGTSTQMNDRSECAALKSVFAGRIEEVRVSSTKSSMGHLIAAAGAVEAVVCCLAIRDSVAPFTANFETPDPDCDVNLVTGSPQPMKIRAALSNSLGFGGSNSSLVFRNPEEVES
ncbi:MAG: beta-ketoacyl-[acyl-carrier-protein] synthase family protein [Verrucomicrobiales bacterium]|jgi:3-oxoacyl-[acyl-carrier-protein] synthase II|nr:beta-ketoacyl-[acyl-carrier-protein] synthase family protein [Verrucomicrobiales bacterium]MBP9224725.1 beta-ketoacyl-[acyl-carrier-protein] synthase family protein [Verrucomicrobiales bacterium]HQZ29297.1 beta-ketoacyl-[acyl-carrier-protein] synthase family protein [Verrucomicrobiales bacterium]